VSVTVADLEGHGTDRIITGAGPGGGPHVRVFSADGAVKGQFFAYDKAVTNGVNVAVGDLNGDDKAEIVTAPASRAGSQRVNYFSNTFDLMGSITFLKPTALGGVSAAVADVTGDSHGDIILARTQGVGAVTVVVSGLSPRDPVTISGNAGLSLAAIDLNGDGHADIVSVPYGGAGKVRLTDASGRAVNGFTFNSPFSTGASVIGFNTKLP
jgi:hypothetical protein